MKKLIFRITVSILTLVAQSCKKEEQRARVAEYYLTSRQIEAAERESGTNAAAAAFSLYLYYSYVHYDPKKSTMWVHRAAELGNPIAQYNLATTINQRGWSRDEYRKWMSLAAAQGDPDAIKAMKRMEERE